ncbi:MAG TPA: hypothetical protein VIU34_30585 [Steroidobacter sp.]
MKSIFLIAVSAALLSACAASGPKTAWGKPGVTKVEYVTDLGTCTAQAAMTQGSGGNSEVAGGVSGQNNSADNGLKQQSTSQPVAGQSSAGSASSIGGSIYRDSAPPDVVNRAANQQQAAEIAASRAKVMAMKSCYVQRGYKEFTLTPEQRAKLGSLQPGSNAYLQYLAEIGADAAVVSAQSAK